MVHIYVEARGRLQVASPIAVCLINLAQGLSMDWMFTFSARLSGQQALRICLIPHPVAGITSVHNSSYSGARDSNSGRRAYRANAGVR